LLVGRLVLGSAESLVGSGSIGWGIGRVGAEHTAKVISWNGIASYGALAIGAPLGVLMVKSLGLWSMGVSILLLCALGLLLAWPKRAAPVVSGKRLPFMQVLGKVFPHGSGLALGSIGFGTIATFITLYYANRGWANAALTLSLFGASFICARLLFGNLINRIGGFRVAIVCLSVETLGLLMLWLAPNAELALAGAALSGFGFSLVFPALGVEAVNQVSAANRGAAVGAYSLFIDLSLGITGPLVGAVASGFGFASMFLFAAAAACCGLVLSLYLYKQANSRRKQSEYGGAGTGLFAGKPAPTGISLPSGPVISLWERACPANGLRSSPRGHEGQRLAYCNTTSSGWRICRSVMRLTWLRHE
jgi:predicted MFS family arabinose efflux permease